MALTLTIGALDGFNPCAMWALVFLIGLLLGMKDRRKMWLLGTIFISSSGLVYFLFMSAWLNLFLFLGFILWVRIIIGLVALAAAGINLKEYYTNKSGSCQLAAGGVRRQRILDKLRDIVQRQSFWWAIGGIFLLGLAVNLVELICSAGLPVIYTQILAWHRLPLWQYYLYLAFYILIFMLDDLIVFVAAMITLRHVGIGEGYQRFSNLIGGVVLLII